MNWKEIKHLEDNKYDIPGNWVLAEYYEAFNALFRIENSLRIFIYLILKKNLEEKWHTLSMTSDDEQESSIGAIAKRRYKQDKNFEYLGFNVPTTLLYLTSGELIRIITDANYWKYFNNYFPSTKEIIRTKLDEISNVRNALAHFRPIRKSDVDLLKTNAIHTLSKVQGLLSAVVNCPDVVPTNTTEEWYNELSELNSELLKFKFMQSKDGNWIEVNLIYNYPILKIDSRSKWSLKHQVLNLKVLPLLETYEKLRNKLLFVSYSEPSGYTSLTEPEYTKTIYFHFSKDVLSKNFQEIKSDLNDYINKVNEEIEMISLDTLARGIFIESQILYGDEKERTNGDKFYVFNTDKLCDQLVDNNIPEFWGTFNYVGSNYISSGSRNPWMPVKISDDKELPF